MASGLTSCFPDAATILPSCWLALVTGTAVDATLILSPR